MSMLVRLHMCNVSTCWGACVLLSEHVTRVLGSGTSWLVLECPGLFWHVVVNYLSLVCGGSWRACLCAWCWFVMFDCLQ